MAAAVPPERDVPLDPKYDHYDFPVKSATKQPGHPGYTTEEQDAKVFQLRTMLEQEGYKDNLDTITMLRFLRARKFDVQLTKQMFTEDDKWRKEFQGGVGHLTRTFDYKERAEIFKYYPQYYHKTDKDGRPLYIEQLGNIDLNAMYKITSADRMLSNLVVEYEKVADPRLPACSRKFDHLLETCCTIMDLKGVGLTKAPSVYSYMGSASGILQDHYPERLGKLYVINAPWGFSSVFAIVKRFLDPVTVSKIHVLGSGYKSELLSQVPAENLPEQFGGTCKCEGGCQFADQGPWQDPQFVRTPAWAKEKDGAAATAAAAPAATVDNSADGNASANTGAATAAAGKTAEPEATGDKVDARVG